MFHEEKFDHFHVVAICTECADIEIIGLAKHKEALAEFFANVTKDLSEVGPDIQFNVEIIVPNEILKISPTDGHVNGHISTCVVHKCTDAYEFCAEMQRNVAFKKMALMLTSQFMDMLTPKRGSKSKEIRKDDKEDVRARNLLDSLDLPDDLFKGFN